MAAFPSACFVLLVLMCENFGFRMVPLYAMLEKKVLSSCQLLEGESTERLKLRMEWLMFVRNALGST